MIFSKKLINWYSVNKRQLPWRETKNPYHIWLSEIILQQTQVNQGLPFYDAFITNFPSVFDLAAAEESEVLKLWQGLGYYSRARNLHASAKYVVNELDGVFPNTYKDLLKLKGVGDYTASAIASFCFNEVTPVVDGNVYRLLSRYYGIDTAINSTKGAKEFKALAHELIDNKKPSEYNQAIMEFGAIQCKPKNPDCLVCPFQESCVAFNNNRIGELPVKIKSAKAKKKYFNFLVFIDEIGNTVLEKREGKGIWQNLYQFPLVETKSNLDADAFEAKLQLHDYVNEQDYKWSQYNKEPIVHKLSHQHLYTTFWIVNIKALKTDVIPVECVRDYAVPILIGNFIESFNF
ncbi:A/G-specific adenine glycosylase [Tamlana sp. 2_MG-2023]|uniref:A/G-specific adenine glycosylase n=1 Tax=unclassified Tamlana TaxID=2614803 RepID=UPI0026E342E5|nr:MULTISPECIES: A/G-specific adenine glycosylase [unclassified Tamlana]MDO6760570.1 A/G-specific adenine glycosylase [Tamlana sp. 2_MG-2023]MDO6790826.1 A/G-specific adenine glycosylase [Tamlana sp. 1_MG-2023]